MLEVLKPLRNRTPVTANRMKAQREHRVPLCERAIAILDEARALGDGLIFPASSAANKALNDTAFVQLLKRLRIDGTAHGFRSSFRDWSAECTSTPREVCEAALAHTLTNKAEAPYARTDHFAKRREFMDAWGRYLNPKPAPVVRLRA